jgi:hypothetical protein
MAQMHFNANEVDGDVKDFSLIPKGKYPAVIISTKMENPNEKGTQQLHVTWEITEGPHAKRQVSNWITVACPTSVEAKDIGLRQLQNACEAVGLAGFTDTDELCGRPHIIDVGEKKDNRDASKVFNEVKRCYPAGAATAPAASQASTQAHCGSHIPPPPTAQPAQPAASPAAAAKRPPWMK